MAHYWKENTQIFSFNAKNTLLQKMMKKNILNFSWNSWLLLRVYKKVWSIKLKIFFILKFFSALFSFLTDIFLFIQQRNIGCTIITVKIANFYTHFIILRLPNQKNFFLLLYHYRKFKRRKLFVCFNALINHIEKFHFYRERISSVKMINYIWKKHGKYWQNSFKLLYNHSLVRSLVSKPW